MPRSAAIVLTMALGVWSITCATPDRASTPTVLPSQSDATPKHVTVDACITAMPADWDRAFGGGTTMPEGMRFGLGNPTIAGTTVFGQYNTATSSGIARLDLSTGRVEKLVAFPPNASGTASIAASPPWLAWTVGNAKENVFDWTVMAMNLETGETLALAKSRGADGTFLPGQQPVLSLRGSTLVWSQALPGPLTQYQSEVHRYDLGAHRDQLIAKGRVSTPAYAADLLIWAERGGDGSYAFHVVDAETLAPKEIPAVLRDPGSIIFLGGDAKHFAWTAEGLLQVNVWRVGANERRTYRAPDIKHYFQFLQFAGDYLLWYSGVTSAVLDLRTGALIDVAGSLAGSDDLIVVEGPVRPRDAKGEVVASRVAAAPRSALTQLECTR